VTSPAAPTKKLSCNAIAAVVLAAFGLCASPGVHPKVGAAQASDLATGSVSGLPVPRFVSIKASKVNMHVGPGKQYDVSWLYQRPGLPVEITAEYENWRRVRDGDGTEGWMYHSMLSGRRSGVVIAKNDAPVPLYDSESRTSAIDAKLAPGVIAMVKSCNGTWCRVTGDGFEGWVEQPHLWGVYPGEKIN
jgi:SH3-like domain-containing protein